MGRWTPEMELLAAIVGCQGNDRVGRELRVRLAAALDRFAPVAGLYPGEWRTLIGACSAWLDEHRDGDAAPPLPVKPQLLDAFEASRAIEKRSGATDHTPAPHFAWQDRADIGDRA